MMSLFSSFDFYLYGPLFLFPLFMFFWLLCSTSGLMVSSFYKSIFSVISTFLLELIGASKSKEIPKFFGTFSLAVFLMFFSLNISSIFPFTFPFTTQMGFVLFFALCSWGSFLFFYSFSNYKKFLSHKVPEGSPLGLSIFLFLVELVSEVIRPLTLSLRLVGNLVVGHVLLSLLFWLIENMSMFAPLFLLLNFVEIMVCVIQSYIFFTLTVMYFSEVE